MFIADRLKEQYKFSYYHHHNQYQPTSTQNIKPKQRLSPYPHLYPNTRSMDAIARQIVYYDKINIGLQFILRHIFHMQPISEVHYEQILMFMENNNIPTFQEAKYLLDNQPEEALPDEQHNPHPAPQLQQQQTDEEIALRYQDHLIRQSQQVRGLFIRMFQGLRWFVFTFFRGFAKLFFPQFLLNRWFRNEFYRIYFNRIKLPLHENRLEELLKETKSTGQRSVMLVVSPKEEQPALTEVLNLPQTLTAIQHKFLFYGSTINFSDIKIIENIDPQGEIIFCRLSVFDQIIIIQRIKIQQAHTLTTQRLDEIFVKGLVWLRRNKNVIIKYINLKKRQMGSLDQQSQYSEIDYEANRQMRAEIDRQNVEYQMMRYQREEQMKQDIPDRNNHKQEDKEGFEQLQIMRRLRRETFPEQPTQGDFLTLCFRCPNGQNIYRNFKRESLVEDVFVWVQLNDEIEFQGNQGFDILFSYPLRSLGEQRQKSIGQILSSNEKVIIREL